MQYQGILSRVATEDVRTYEAGLYTWIDSDAQGAAAMQEIRSQVHYLRRQKRS